MICPIITYGSLRDCQKENCGFWSTKYNKCSIVALAEKDLTLKHEYPVPSSTTIIKKQSKELKRWDT
jgi:hypothetical protein